MCVEANMAVQWTAGVCRVLNMYWEMVPTGTTTALLEVSLVVNMHFDHGTG